MDYAAILEQTRTNVQLLRKEGVMSSNEATTILDIIAMIVSRLHGGATSSAKAPSIVNNSDSVNVVTTHFPFKARAVVTHEKARDPYSDPADVLFYQNDHILITGEYDLKYWLGSLQDGRSGKVPKEKVERMEKAETVLSYRAETPAVNEGPPAYTVTADPIPDTEAPAVPPSVRATSEPHRSSMAPVPGPSTGPSLHPPFEASGPALDRNPALNRNTTLPPRPNRNSRPDMDLRRVNTAQTRRPSPQPAHSPSSQPFNQRFSQVMEPSSPSFAPTPHREEHIRPPQPYSQPPYNQRPSSVYASPPNMQDPAYPPSMASPPFPLGSSSYPQPSGPPGGIPSMPMPSVPGQYTAPGPSGYYNN